MKKITIYIFTITFIIGTIALFYSCNKDKCKEIICQNGGSCIEGTCDCLGGYYGDNCEKVNRDFWLNSGGTLPANFVVIDNCTSSTYSYTITIKPSSTAIDEVLIDNFYNIPSLNNVRLKIITDMTFEIPNQIIAGYTISGSGNYNIPRKKFNMSYNILSSTSNDACGASASKQ